ncbi:integration host factor subunit beta [Candidatus Erwinia haradaeae]|uniref:Integration host factor subunit beta n=1 Tax=Candidatus Erwinia haradaeae TaxID=1922217 RepID=A0A803GD01_9GAMM|nr:integration host factor subunit beta [Candidatus Erwinia haradaeae]VFP88873.1 Integration host factor subunit beta [Candidatus Erwinia haradaeae]
MTKTELIEKLAAQQSHISIQMIEDVIQKILEQMIGMLSKGERIEIRGFGSFSLHYRSSRIGRNPKTGEKVKLKSKSVPYFKPGKELRNRANFSD